MFLKTLILKLRQSKFINLGLCRNQWLWFHLISGLIISDLLIYFNVNSILFFFGNFTVAFATLINVLLFAILWEIIELFTKNEFLEIIEFIIHMGGPLTGIEKTYGSKEKWFWDSIGDILGAVFVSLFNIIFVHFYFVVYY